jgi:predicted dehydrogenase
VGLEVLSSGRHLLVEKPIALTVGEGRELVAAAERAGRVLMVAESACYSFAARKVPELIAEGLIGRPLLARSILVGKLRDDWGGRPHLLDRRQSGGGMFMTSGIHDAALLRRILGEVASVFARRVQPEDDDESVVDTVAASLRFAGGGLGQMITSLNIEQYDQVNGCKIHGSEGTVSWRRKLSNAELAVHSERFGPAPRRFANPSPEVTPFVAETGHFADCVADGSAPQTSGADQVRSLAVIEAAYRSLETDRAEAPEA